MSKIKDKITNCTKQTMYIFGDGYSISFSGKGLIRHITIMQESVGMSTTMKFVIIPFTEKAVLRDIWIPTLAGDILYIIKNAIRPCTLDDIEDWINLHFQKG